MSAKQFIGDVLSGMGPGILSGVGKALTDDGKPAHFESRQPEATSDNSQPAIPKYKKGTDYVPKTGPAILHKGEAVLNKEDAQRLRDGKMSKTTKTTTPGSKSETTSKEHNVSLYRAMSHLNKGGLHRALGVKEGEKIPADKLAAAKKSKNPHIRKMAQFAGTMKGFKH